MAELTETRISTVIPVLTSKVKNKTQRGGQMDQTAPTDGHGQQRKNTTAAEDEPEDNGR